ncbi:GTPase Era [Piscinibacter koreensis]|uniref:GTPase Era n=1 Tax=Piscinibacter koreensis TaxID=2742824 RepID=A0A7Y6NPH9_9BURK|nr:GTPase Era [Schlegelella koreensis]NUZ06961.1 GTPase Era [Schlegelella koreensis]
MARKPRSVPQGVEPAADAGGGEAAPEGAAPADAPEVDAGSPAHAGGVAHTAVEAGLDATPQRCGRVAIIGRPNVGKSTLLNALVGQKISITSDKAQTTRHRIDGVQTRGDTQYIFVDTPGFQTRRVAALNRTLNRTVHGVLTDVDAVLLVVEAGRFGPDDEKVLALVPRDKPVLLVANKLDTVVRRADLMPWLQSMQQRFPFAEFVPMSAKKNADVERLFDIVRPYLPEQPWIYDADALTDRTDRFLVSEIVREKLFRLTGDELPYTSTVVIDSFVEEGELRRIAATVIVERESHKGIVIGTGGERLKRIGSEARQELERLLDAKVFLELWVKVRAGWADDEAHLRSYGY